MRKILFMLFSVCIWGLFPFSTNAQETPTPNKTKKLVEEDEGPIMFKFEPDFVSKNEKKKAEIARTRSIIDTLNISDRKRLKLLRDLYKNGISRRLQKAMLVENTYDEIED
ncbi:hypothetical protein [Maribacter sp. 2308TA10-17]|uniref:hypothetical protein n=1 Tax=Maribacter sp. 2308TA10-17 TaxID=3386276 RepID=UPI0039BC2215